jgi:hypothetical protein
MARSTQGGGRKIEPSFQGRLKFLPGDDHPLDVMIQEAQQLWEQVLREMGSILEELGTLDRMGDPSTGLAAEDQAIQHVIRSRYRDHKHRDHILVVFMSLYRKRLLARLEAAQEALALARELLTPDDTPRQSIEQALAIDPIVADISRADLVGNAQAVRRQLRGCDERLQTIRKGLTLGNGWFERFFLTRKRRKPGSPTVTYGPYLKYRWREGPGPKYTISMGLIPNSVSGEGALE